ncbi:MAG TPA: hypothetical protein VJ805_04830 [Nitrospiraceae bacterium]|nr:hypothetical protein [Nitrospiraceae bacterium]
MMSKTRLAYYAFLCGALQTLPALGQEPILPHGDPRLQSAEEERARREEIRDQRLKQQGQGSNYRIEGEPQSSADTTEPSAGAQDVPGQDTRIADPSVNPGQAAGMRTVQGRIVDSKSDRLVVHLRNGTDTTLMIDNDTVGDTDLRPGDIVTGMVTPQGRVVTIQKKPGPPANIR